MNDAAATQSEYTGFTPGAAEAEASNRIFVNLRIGKIAETSNTERAGFVPVKTKNKAGTEFHFFARPYDHITGYVTDVRWHVHTLADGTVLTGWNITIDTGEQGVFVLGLRSKDRPYQRVMSTLVNVDFERPVRFVGFMGKNKTTQQEQKVLLITQEMGPDKPIWLQPATQEKWLSRMIIQKLKNGVALNDAEEKNVSRDKEGKFNKNYPYIVEGMDGKWAFNVWNDFLHEQVNECVIPNVKAANESRGYAPQIDEDRQFTGAPIPDESPAGVTIPTDDDIPF